jgi:hypothetical protein
LPPRSEEELRRPSPVRLHQIAARDIDVRLALAAATEVPIGGGRVVLENGVGLSVRGRLHHEVDSAPTESALEFALEGLCGRLEALQLGRATLAAGVELAASQELVLRFRGLAPVQFSGALPELGLYRLALHW